MDGRLNIGRLFLCGIGGMLIVAGGLFFALMWRSYERASAMAGWPQVEARVLRSEVAERRISPAAAPEFRFEVLYGYDWHGLRLSSDRWTLRGSPWSSRRDPAAELVREFPVGAVVTCRVDPSDPQLAVLKPDSRAPGYSLWFPAIFVVGGAGVIAGALRRREPAAGVRHRADGQGIVAPGDER